jgi:uncharacterized protein YbjQ (UPF0145 family)
VKDFIITTTNQLEGYIITEYLDVFFEESIFGISISTGIKGLGDMFAGLAEITSAIPTASKK